MTRLIGAIKLGAISGLLFLTMATLIAALSLVGCSRTVTRVYEQDKCVKTLTGQWVCENQE